MTTYAEFKDLYVRTLWQDGNTDFEADLDALVRMAEARISRDLRRHSLMASFSATTSLPWISLPGDFKELVTVFQGDDQLTVYPPDTFAREWRFPWTVNRGRIATIHSNRLWLAETDPLPYPANVTATYYMGLVPYAQDPAEPFYDEHPDFYTAAVNLQAYSYLRDFDLSTEFGNKYQEILDTMIRDSNYAMFPSGQLQGVVPEGSGY